MLQTPADVAVSPISNEVIRLKHTRNICRTFLPILLLSLILSYPALAAITPEKALERLFTQELEADWFAPLFLAQLPVQQVELIIDQLTPALGAYEGVTSQGDQYLVHFAAGILPTQISLDVEGKIQGLFFQPPRPKTSDLDDIVQAFAELPGETALLVASNEGILAAHNPEQPLAVASAFKLAVLAALRDEIDTGRLAWDDVVALPQEASSLPTGILQEWPTGSPLTVHSLAALMISLSDNTATDALIGLVGRERIERYAPQSTPLLTTREAFLLKDPANEELLTAYRSSGADERRALLAELTGLPLPSVTVFTSGTPMALDIEWFFNVYELCALMNRVQDLPLMAINPGIASPTQWERVAYKGGSEPGVLSLVTWLTGHNGQQYCVAAVWNDDTALDESAFFGLYAALIDQLALAGAP